jgi:hypothetical protein
MVLGYDLLHLVLGGFVKSLDLGVFLLDYLADLLV